MMYFSRLKTMLIVGVCLLGALLCLPNLLPQPASWVPWRQVHLGLDLRGGSYLLLEVDMDAVRRERLDAMADAARTALRAQPTVLAVATPQPGQNRTLVRVTRPDQRDEALKRLRAAATNAGTTTAEYDVEALPDGQYSMTLLPAALRERASGAVLQSIEIVRRRIDETGVVDPQITRQGENRIVVQLPGVEDPNRIKELLGRTARMTFRLVDENANPAQPPPPGVDFLPMENNPQQKIAVRRRVEVDGANLTDARPGQSGQTGEWVVNFTFDSLGARRFGDVSRANVGHPFAIVLDDKVISAPVIREAITGGRGQISGSFNVRSATDLSVLLRAGALPAPLTVVEERSVGPELGADSIRAGAISLAVGFVLVIIYMARVLRPVRLVRQRRAGHQLDLAGGRAVPAGGHADPAGHGRHPADPGRGGGRQHPGQRTHPRGSPRRPAPRLRHGNGVPPGLQHHHRQQHDQPAGARDGCSPSATGRCVASRSRSPWES